LTSGNALSIIGMSLRIYTFLPESGSNQIVGKEKVNQNLPFGKIAV
jgi:hypothetical protein